MIWTKLVREAHQLANRRALLEHYKKSPSSSPKNGGRCQKYVKRVTERTISIRATPVLGFSIWTIYYIEYRKEQVLPRIVVEVYYIITYFEGIQWTVEGITNNNYLGGQLFALYLFIASLQFYVENICCPAPLCYEIS